MLRPDSSDSWRAGYKTWVCQQWCVTYTIVNMPDDVALALGPMLKSLRDLSGKSLKTIAEQADISPAYLQKLERGEVITPSPHVLHRLAKVLGTDYVSLMRAAGYVVPESVNSPTGGLARALLAHDLTDDEAHALTAYLKVYRSSREK